MGSKYSFKQQCQQLRLAGYTLPQIAEETGRSKTSVYFHINHIPLSQKRRKEIAQAATRRILEATRARKGKSALGRQPIPFSSWTPESVFAISHFAFDGELRHYLCAYYNRSRPLIDRLQKCMKSMYDYPPARSTKSNGVITIAYFNVELAAYIKKKRIELFDTIEILDSNLQLVFLRAFFDDEGCMDYKPSARTRRIRGYQHNSDVLKLIQRLLQKFGIQSTIRTSSKEIVISGRDQLCLFRNLINFSPGVKINGKRSNSVWKKSYEKRWLLEKAIASYKKL